MSIWRSASPTIGAQPESISLLPASGQNRRLHLDVSSAEMSGNPCLNSNHVAESETVGSDVSPLERPAMGLPSQTDEEATIHATNLDSDKASYDVQRPIKATLRKTVAIACLLFSLALLCCILHYVFFSRLNGSEADGDRAPIRQSYVTAVSIILATLFRAALLGSVGMCFAQRLWRTLRDNAIPVDVIENLFQLRHNPLELFNFQAIKYGFLLFGIAVSMWLVPLATTFPPGALTIAARPFALSRLGNASVLNPFLTDAFDPFLIQQNKTLSRVWISDTEGSTSWQYIGGRKLVSSLANLVLSSGVISDIPRPSLDPNSTYFLSFTGPQLSCEQVNINELTSSSVNLLSILPDTQSQGRTGFADGVVLSVTQSEVQGVSGCNSNASEAQIAVVTKGIQCRALYVQYDLNVTYVQGVRHLTYQMHSLDPQPEPIFNSSLTWDTGEKMQDIPDPAKFLKSLPDYKQWVNELRDRLQFWNAHAMLSSMITSIRAVRSVYCADASGSSQCARNFTTSNGTTVAITNPLPCWMPNGQEQLGPVKLLDSGLNSNRFSNTDDDAPAEDFFVGLNITEASLNELLTNITFSSLSLGIWHSEVSINVTEYRNTYQFSHPISLVLPYSLCLGIGVIILVLGMHSLWCNEVPATDGGFLQVMMATKGGTKLERLVVQQGLVASDAIPKELKALEIRYGELMAGDNTVSGGLRKRYGFGTVDETIYLGKHK
ncbi:hypothetical protein OPT61_g1851 [Boeremia exigua]|uniref:Uncharacterized protein n=1 Tax=Boeremia exigua TaxID=749465 RepID=A0ACC2INM1_9PLEO|nr:hypothetical protein OPT61_g1851 [Boeremia exigua]